MYDLNNTTKKSTKKKSHNAIYSIRLEQKYYSTVVRHTRNLNEPEGRKEGRKADRQAGSFLVLAFALSYYSLRLY
jgi:hypothetical protein